MHFREIFLYYISTQLLNLITVALHFHNTKNSYVSLCYLFFIVLNLVSFPPIFITINSSLNSTKVIWRSAAFILLPVNFSKSSVRSKVRFCYTLPLWHFHLPLYCVLFDYFVFGISSYWSHISYLNMYVWRVMYSWWIFFSFLVWAIFSELTFFFSMQST